ncbi:hypothetical protein HPB50_009926 [Hyalomma asiaticum]|uniref:Uncharacterized protein n=1 Tax=Hyalomma asiaticum TaxID=266040 RepID=A0ACB7RVU8_HYAAI|nr:hypothetical protein HPB50_009926 [Hyalomma asiaticum]
MSADGGTAYEKADSKLEVPTESVRWRWNRKKVFHWVFLVSSVLYALWRFSVDDENAFLQREMRRAFRSSPYGLRRKVDDTHWEWKSTSFLVTKNLMWFLLHPLLGRATAGIAQPLVPVFYAMYASLFVALQLSWEVALAFLTQHAAFFALSALRVPAFCYAMASLMLLQKRIYDTSFFHLVYNKYGQEVQVVAYIAYHWNILRCLSFSLDFTRAEREKPEDSGGRWPPYWKTLAYVVYMPAVYFGPLQNYHDFVAQWPWMIAKLGPASLVGFGLSLLFFFYVRYVFNYGFAGALARAEGIEIPPHAKCIARLNKCSQFWRYLTEGCIVHSKVIYEPVSGGRKGAAWLVLGTTRRRSPSAGFGTT